MICRPAHSNTSADETVSGEPQSDQTVTNGKVASDVKENEEAEISRLTWAVLDGKATVADRHRLAELVGALHAERGVRGEE